MRELRRLRRCLPDGHVAGQDPHRAGPTRAQHPHDLCLLRRGLRPQGRDERQHRRAPGALEGRSGQRGPRLCEGPLRLGLRHPPRAHHPSDDPKPHHRPVARGELGRSHRPRRVGVQAHPGRARPRFGGRHQLLALHQRGGLPRAKAGACGVRQQQHRHLRAGVPLAHRVWAGPGFRHLGGHAGLQVGGARRRDRGDRRQPDRRAPGVRLAHEAPAARRRPAGGHRPAAYRSGGRPARARRAPSGAQAGHQRGPDHGPGVRGGHRGAAQRGLCGRAL